MKGGDADRLDELIKDSFIANFIKYDYTKIMAVFHNPVQASFTRSMLLLIAFNIFVFLGTLAVTLYLYITPTFRHKEWHWNKFNTESEYCKNIGNKEYTIEWNFKSLASKYNLVCDNNPYNLFGLESQFSSIQ